MDSRVSLTEKKLDFSKELKDPYAYLDTKIETKYPDIAEDDLVEDHDQKKQKTEEEIDFYYVAMDMDGAYHFSNFETSTTPYDLFKANLPYFNNILKDLRGVKEGIKGISASNRINAQMELGAQRGRSNSFHITFYKYFINKIKKFLNHSKDKETDKKIPSCEMDYFSLEDIFYGQQDGKTFARICQMTQGSHSYPKQYRKFQLGVTPYDYYKIINLYAIMHRAAVAHRGKNIVIDFSDDQEDIVQEVKNFFTKYPQLIPPQVTLKIRHKTSDNIPGNIIGILRGDKKNKIDYNYRYNVMKLRACQNSEKKYPHEKINPFIETRKTEKKDINPQDTDALVLQNILSTSKEYPNLASIVNAFEAIPQSPENIKNCIALSKAIYEMEMFKQIENEEDEKYTHLVNTVKENQLFLDQNKIFSEAVHQYQTLMQAIMQLQRDIRALPQALEVKDDQQALLQIINDRICSVFLRETSHVRKQSGVIALQERCCTILAYLKNLKNNITQAKLLNAEDSTYTSFNEEIMTQHIMKEKTLSKDRAKRELFAYMPEMYPQLEKEERSLYEAIKKEMVDSKYSEAEKIALNNILDYIQENSKKYCDSLSFYDVSVIERDVLIPYYKSINPPGALDEVFASYHLAITERKLENLKKKSDKGQEEYISQIKNDYHKHLGSYIRLFNAITISSSSSPDCQSMITLAKIFYENNKKNLNLTVEFIKLFSLINEYLQSPINFAQEFRTLHSLVTLIYQKLLDNIGNSYSKEKFTKEVQPILDMLQKKLLSPAPDEQKLTLSDSTTETCAVPDVGTVTVTSTSKICEKLGIVFSQDQSKNKVETSETSKIILTSPLLSRQLESIKSDESESISLLQSFHG